MIAQLPYCGSPPLPGMLLSRFNLDPVLIAVLLLFATVHIARSTDRRTRVYAVLGWAFAAAALAAEKPAIDALLSEYQVPRLPQPLAVSIPPHSSPRAP